MELKNKYLLFSLIVLINILLKSFFGSEASFNYDEIISVKDTLLDFGHIKHEAEWDNNPPFYYYCLWVWHKIIPISEFNSRLLSVLFVSFSIGLSFLFALKYFNYRTALYSAILLTFSNFILYYSLETRTYSLVLLLALLSSLQFFKFLENPTLKNNLILALINFLIIYSHYISGIIILVQYLVIIIYFKDQVKRFISIQSIIICGLVFLRFTKKQFLHIINFNHKEDFWLKTTSFADLHGALNSLFYNQITLWIFLVGFVVFIYYHFNNKKEKERLVQLYCFLIGIFPIILLFIVGLFKAVFLDRYLIFCIPFVTILIVFQLTRSKIIGTVVVYILFIIQILNYKFVKGTGMDYRAISKVVKQNEKSNDYIVINTKDNTGLFEYYYDKEKFIKYKNIDSIAKSQKIYGVNNVESLKELTFLPGNTIFLIQSFHKIGNTNNPVEEYLSDKFNKVYSTNYFNGIEFTIFKTN